MLLFESNTEDEAQLDRLLRRLKFAIFQKAEITNKIIDIPLENIEQSRFGSNL